MYAAGSTTALMNGRSYNRGVRAHKLCFEAFFCLLWKAFLVWYSKEEEGRSALMAESTTRMLASCRAKVDARASTTEGVEDFESLREGLQDVIKKLEEFKEERRKASKLFAFWEEYGTMVDLLLQLIKVERTGNWKLHLCTVAAIVPYFFAMDRHNYSRWLPVYLFDMQQLETKHPRVHQEFVNGNHVVSRSSNPSPQVSTDMALEQSINADSKAKGVIVGISQRPGTLQRWFLTSHERAAITTSLKNMYGVEKTDRLGERKKASANRVTRDECDVSKLLVCFTSGAMTHHFADDTRELVNFATGVVLPSTIAEKMKMKTFVEKRLNTDETSFWDPVTSLKIKTFSTTTKKTSVKSINEKLISVSADRDLFGRLPIAKNARQINLREVLSYELSTLPFVLSHQDRSLRKTTKGVVLNLLQEQVEVLTCLIPSALRIVHIIDGMATVQMMKSVGTTTFGELAMKYFTSIVSPLSQSNCSEVHLVFDQYWETSIKGGERARRGTSSFLEIRINGPSTPIPKQWSKYIRNLQNKDQHV